MTEEEFTFFKSILEALHLARSPNAEIWRHANERTIAEALAAKGAIEITEVEEMSFAVKVL